MKSAVSASRCARLALPLAYMFGILLLSSIPGDSGTALSSGWSLVWLEPRYQNLLHMPVYAGLAWSWVWALAPLHLSLRRRLWLAGAASAGWALFDEVYQTHIPGRFGSLTDVALDLAGIAVLLAACALRRRPV
jgi:hypothetical protein